MRKFNKRNNIRISIENPKKKDAKSNKFNWISQIIIPVILGTLTFIVAYQGNKISEAQHQLNTDQQLRLELQYKYQKELKYLELFYKDIKDSSTQENAIELLNIMNPDLGLKLASSSWSGLSEMKRKILAAKATVLKSNLDSMSKISSKSNLIELIDSLESRIQSITTNYNKLLDEKLLLENENRSLLSRTADTSVFALKSELQNAGTKIGELKLFQENVNNGSIQLEKYVKNIEYERMIQSFPCVKVLGSSNYKDKITEINGLVLNENEDPVSGVRIQFSGSQTVFTTDQYGEFTADYTKSSSGITLKMRILNAEYDYCTDVPVVIGSNIEISLRKKK